MKWLVKSSGNRPSSPQGPATRSQDVSVDPEDVKVPDWRRPAALGYLIIVLTFFVFGGWSAVAKLDSAVMAPGVVTNETNKRTVQHLEGGIVREIFVREGQHVQQGQPLFRIDPISAQATFDVHRNQLDFTLAQEARLIAERDGASAITFPAELQNRRDDATAKKAMSDQVKQFDERRASLTGQIDLLQTKINQYQTEISGLQLERNATDRQLKFIKEELSDVQSLLEKQLVQKSRAMALEREKARLEGIIGRSTAEQAKAENGIGEANLQIRQTRQKFLEEVAGQILEVRSKIADIREKLRVAGDVLGRVDIVSPETGTLQSLKVFTVGGVIRAGEPLVEVVPDTGALIVQAHVSPLDTERLISGNLAEIRFSSFRANVLPVIMGRVETVSKDRLMDDTTKTPYFLAQVVADDVPEEVRERLTAGMPAEVIMPTGERTVLDYLVRPLKDRLRSALRER
jgi:HlyD family type I secretion membrane fusion protein